MPPQLSDDERSESSDVGNAPRKRTPITDSKGKSKSNPRSYDDEEPLMVGSDGSEEDEEHDEEVGEDEFVVEAITDHAVDEQGNLFFEVKWEGFEKKSDRTMEPEENLAESASEILNDYLESIGGREALLAAWEEKKEAAKKGKKRGRSGTETNGTNGTKRGRKTHPAKSPSASGKAVEFKPPSGSWEDEVVNIDACEGAEGSVIVYLTWKGGHKSQHPLVQVYKRCPQRMLRFYESHLVFRKNDPDEDNA